MGELSALLLVGLTVCVGVALVYAAARGTFGPLLLGAALVVLVLAVPISYERIDAHDLLECGSVLDPAGWEPSGLPGDRALECDQAYRRRYIWSAGVAGMTVVSAGFVVLRRRRARAVAR